MHLLSSTCNKFGDCPICLLHIYASKYVVGVNAHVKNVLATGVAGFGTIAPTQNNQRNIVHAQC